MCKVKSINSLMKMQNEISSSTVINELLQLSKIYLLKCNLLSWQQQHHVLQNLMINAIDHGDE